MWVLVLIIAILLVVTIILAIRIHNYRQTAKEITISLCNYLDNDTNTLIDVSTRDKQMRKMVGTINKELKRVRQQHHRYENGDRELKEAVTNISHDLRTPLTAICGYIDLLENEELSDNAKIYLSYLKERTETLKNLTEELFRYSVITSVSDLNYEEFDIRKVLEESLLSFCGAFEQKEIEPSITLPKNSVYRKLDKSALSRIFTNIISNAIKYSDGDFTVLCENNGKIIFSNTASELSNVDVAKLFDRFYTVDSARKSTGLGLAIAKLLTERMNGKIYAEYKSNKISIVVDFQK